MTARSEAPSAFRSTSVRPGPLGLVSDGLVEVFSRRRLIGYLVRADLKKKGADTLLGNVWWVVDPLLQMLVYVVLVEFILKRKTPDYPIFVISAILPWKWFQSAVGDGGSSVRDMGGLIKQLNFPKLVLPVASVMAGVANFAFGLIPLLAMSLLFYPSRVSAWMFLIPVVAVVQLVFSLAVSTVLSAINVFYRDVGNMSRHLLRLWFYLSPALYGADTIKEIAKDNPPIGTVFALNPWTTLFNSYRDLIYYEQPPEWKALFVLGVVSVGLLLLAILIFKRLEPTFAKIL